MSEKDLKLSVLISAKDGMSKQAERIFSAMNQSAIRAATGMTKADSKIMVSQQRMFSARELLGMRSEQKIQREIKQTEAAYNRLMRSGNVSMREQARATDMMRSKVQQLNNEMGKLTKMQKMAAGGRLLAAGTAGVVVAGMVVKPAIDKALNYDLRLAHMSNTAFSGQSLNDRRSGKNTLDTAIKNAIRNGGGSRDNAAQTLDTILASGAIKDPEQALKLLVPTVMSATSANADATDFAMVGAKGAQSFGLDPSRIQDAYDAMIGGGQAGSFEAKDQARYLPQQMAFAKNAGMSGISDFRKLIAYNQAAATTAGNSDEAGNNMANLLAKISSKDTALDVKKNLGIDLPKYLAAQKNNGVDAVAAFANLIDKSVEKNPAYKQLKQKLASAKNDPERQATLASMVDILQGSEIGNVIQDMQAMKAAVGVINSKKNGYIDEVSAKTNKTGNAKDNFALIEETGSFKAGQVTNEKEIAQQTAMDKLTPSIGALSDVVVDAARAYPELTTATVAATTALAALAAAGFGAAGANVLTGGGGASKLSKVGVMAKGLGGFALKRALPLYGAWEAGQFVGGGLNSAINWGINKTTDSGNLGSLIYDLTHKEQNLNGKIEVSVNQDGRVVGANFKTNQPGVKTNVSNGLYMFTDM